MLATAVASPAIAQEAAPGPSRVIRFDMAAGPCRDVLVAIGARAGVQVDVSERAIGTRNCAAVQGAMSLEAALRAALGGSGLVLRRGDRANFIVSAGDDGDGAGAEVVVIGRSADGYFAVASSSATRTDTAIIDTPQSVQTITNELLKSRQAITAEDGLRLASGVTLDQRGLTTVPVIRGFEAPVMTDGLVGNNSSTSSAGLRIPTIGIEQVNVIKGADSIIAGAMRPGGVVDVTRKRPQARRVTEMLFRYGSFGDHVVSVDMTGGTGLADGLSYRLIGSIEGSRESFGGYDGRDAYYVSPSIGYRSGSLDLVAGFEQNDQRQPVLPLAISTETGPVETGRMIGHPTDFRSLRTSLLYYDADITLSNAIRFSSKSQYQTSRARVAQNEVSILSPAALFALTYQRYSDERLRQFSTANDFHFDFATGAVTHRVLAGGSYQYGRSQASDSQFNIDFGSLLTMPFEPVGPAEDVADMRTVSNSTQFYLQEQASFGAMHLIASISRAEVRTRRDQDAANRDVRWLPNAGVLFKLTDSMSLYGNYMTSFSSQALFQLENGEVAPPVSSNQQEVGLKMFFNDQRAFLTLAGYRAAARNVVFSLPNGRFAVNPGSTVTKGIEADVNGRIASFLNASANYTYTTVDRSSVSLEQEGYLFSLPKHTYNAWITADLFQRSGQKLSIGGGATGRSGYSGPSYRPFEMPGQVSFDATAIYNVGNLTFNATIRNLADRRLYGDYAQSGVVVIQPGRTVALSLNAKF
ncbi:MAG: hypothetical protein DI632_10770 [Sphingomonas hengshuiensis]|uniref:Secretin/TonB short N-terminal domain-containing protein n=1 Tax=Sphingomonas hengshuiensis TaxID=1609977 RepID=A0A2W4Z8R2_9SPHN|nr:MAG: hypothetical protein DI632_10770 [Sphingomonas hengshuiensis]